MNPQLWLAIVCFALFSGSVTVSFHIVSHFLKCKNLVSGIKSDVISE